MADPLHIAVEDPSQSKLCTRCGLVQPIASFQRDRTQKDGHTVNCRTCRAWYGKRYRAAKPRIITAEQRARKIEYQAAYFRANRKRLGQANQEWIERNRDKVRAATREAQRRYRATARAKAKARAERLDPRTRLDEAIARRIWRSLKGQKQGRRTFDLLGYSAEQLHAHVEKQFISGMTWENYGKVWHLDHIVPLSAHNYTAPEHIDFKRAWALSNLRPLWAFENLSKSNRLLAPFQPALQL